MRRYMKDQRRRELLTKQSKLIDKLIAAEAKAHVYRMQLDNIEAQILLNQ